MLNARLTIVWPSVNKEAINELLLRPPASCSCCIVVSAGVPAYGSALLVSKHQPPFGGTTGKTNLNLVTPKNMLTPGIRDAKMG
jgi:hypothetical protein